MRYMKYQGTYPARDYVDSLDVAAKAALVASAKFISDGHQLPSSKGHQLKGRFSKLYELKPEGHRFYGFFHSTPTSDVLYLACGAPKRNEKAQDADRDRALTMYEDFLAHLGQ